MIFSVINLALPNFATGFFTTFPSSWSLELIENFELVRSEEITRPDDAYLLFLSDLNLFSPDFLGVS